MAVGFIAAAGVGTAFAVNAASFLGVILVIARWKRPPAERKGPVETVTGATVAAIRYVRYSPSVRLVPLRSGSTMFFASGLLALLPSVAHNVSKSSVGYGALLGCFGLGAVIGALLMRSLRARGSSEIVVSSGVVVFGLSMIAAGLLRSLPALCLNMLIAGAAWIVFISIFSALILSHAPDWVRARVVAVSLLILQGSMAAGSAVWGAMATRTGIHTALIWAGIGAISTALGLFLKLPSEAVDLKPWVHWQHPTMSTGESALASSGPTLVTVEYDVAPEHEAEFLRAIQQYERIRRRDGAYRWGIFRDIESPSRYLETFLVAS